MPEILHPDPESRLTAQKLVSRFRGIIDWVKMDMNLELSSPFEKAIQPKLRQGSRGIIVSKSTHRYDRHNANA
jgi:hypothetical protein